MKAIATATPKCTVTIAVCECPAHLCSHCEKAPLHAAFWPAESTSSATAISCPRLLAVMGNASSLEIVEEYAPGPGARTKYFTNTVTEVQLSEDAELTHGSVILSKHMRQRLLSLQL